MDLLCPWEPAKYLIFSSNIPQLLFYSHFTAIIVAMLLSFLVFYNNRNSLLTRLLLGISTIFSSWVFIDLILWATNRPDTTIFYWSLQILLEVFVFILAFYFVYVYLKNKFPPFWANLSFFVFITPFILLNSTKYSLMGVDLNYCYAIENDFIIFYSYIIEILITLLIVFLSVYFYKKENKRRKEILLFFLGITFFLSAFVFGNIIGSFTDDWISAQYGLFGMPIFIGFLTYIIVKFEAFNMKLMATQALVWGLAVLVGSQFFFIKVTINYYLTAITFISAIIFGQFLISSVKKEVKQKEELLKLNIDLENLVKQRESLMHLINHKVKGAFTHSKYIFSEMLEGSFGALTPGLEKMAKMGLDSDKVGVETIDLILNASNLQKGIIQYDMKPTIFRNIVTDSILKKSGEAEQRGLKLEGNITDDECMVDGDAFWLKEVVNNLIDNSIKYTPKGNIDIVLKKESSKIILFVKDNGVGITDEDKANMFTEGGRGKNSVKVNVDSTGYGLYTVKLIVEAHHGRVWVESDGQDKGATFFVELDAI